jgi:heme exporter protein D
VDALDSWDVALFVVAGYIAVVSLVRLMLGRRNTLARQVRDELERQSSEAQRQAEETEQNRPAQTPVPQTALAAKKKA